MATMFTRTINTFKATAYTVGWDGDKPIAEKLGEVVYNAASDNDSMARAALKESGVACPRGTKIKVEKIAEEVYGMTVEEFMAYAHKVER